MKLNLLILGVAIAACAPAQAQLEHGTEFRLDGEVEHIGNGAVIGTPASAHGTCGIRVDMLSEGGHAAWCSTKREWVKPTADADDSTAKLECVLYAHWRGPNAGEDKDQSVAIDFNKDPTKLRTKRVLDIDQNRTICSVALTDQ